MNLHTQHGLRRTAADPGCKRGSSFRAALAGRPPVTGPFIMLWDYIGIMEKKMETTGIIGVI